MKKIIATAAVAFALGFATVATQAQSTACKQLDGVAADWQVNGNLATGKYGTATIKGFSCLRFLGDKYTVVNGKITPQFTAPAADSTATYNRGWNDALTAVVVAIQGSGK